MKRFVSLDFARGVGILGVLLIITGGVALASVPLMQMLCTTVVGMPAMKTTMAITFPPGLCCLVRIFIRCA